jgi:hypothetical protein
MYKLYNDLECKFKGEAFNGFHLLEGKHEGLSLIFIKSPLGDVDLYAIKFNRHTIWVHSWQQTIGVALLVNLT